MAEKEVKLTVDDFEEWQMNPVTQAVFAHVKDLAVGLRNNRSERLEDTLDMDGKELFQVRQKLVFESGVIKTCEDFVNLTLEDIS